MFTGAQIVTTKLVYRNKQKDILDSQNEDKIAQDFVNMSTLVPRSRAAIVAETQSEKVQRKILAQERKHERIVEQQKLAQHMEDLMKKVLHETPLSKKDEENLRNKVKTIMDKVKQESEKNDLTSVQSSSSRIKSDSVEQSNQGAFLLWHDKNFNR